MKKICIALSIVCVSLSIFTYRTANENHRLNMVNTLNGMENRILREEIADLEKLPSYENGRRDAIIQMGGPQSGTTYHDGWKDAMELNGEGWAGGYHCAIQQFGYQKPNYTNYLAEKPKENNDKTEKQLATK